MRLYLDTAPVVYFVEQVPTYINRVRARITTPGMIQVVSELTRLECRVKPIRDNNLDLLASFDDYFTQVVSEIVPLSRQVIDKATSIRAEYRFTTADAIHLAAAVVSNCDVFLTNDQRLTKFAGITIDSLG